MDADLESLALLRAKLDLMRDRIIGDTCMTGIEWGQPPALGGIAAAIEAVDKKLSVEEPADGR